MYRFIEAEKACFSVRMLVRVLGVSKSAYYAWRKRRLSDRELRDQHLARQILMIHRGSHGTYGAPRVHAELREDHGERVARKRVARLMRQLNITGVHRRRYNDPKYPGMSAVIDEKAYPDLVQRVFTADAPNRKWVADLTQHPTDEGWVYLAAVLDLFGRSIVGWATGNTKERNLVINALQMAQHRRQPPPGVVHHSDRGAQYTSYSFGRHLERYGMLGSMGRVGSAPDNAAMESFFATLQTELLDRHRWHTRRQLISAIFEYIEQFYNPRRRHSALGYLSPHEYERRHALATAAM